MNREGQRKVRNDKKRDIKPTISRELKDCIYRLSYITDRPVKDVVEDICLNGLNRKKVISYLSRNFRRDIRIDNVLYFGDIERVPVSKRTATGQSERISTRVNTSTHDIISTLAFALDCSVSRACALLLDASVRNIDFLNDFVERYLKDHVDNERMKELKQIFKYVNENNPYSEEVTWPSFLSYLIDEVKEGAEKVQDTVTDFIVNNWKK